MNLKCVLHPHRFYLQLTLANFKLIEMIVMVRPKELYEQQAPFPAHTVNGLAVTFTTILRPRQPAVNSLPGPPRCPVHDGLS